MAKKKAAPARQQWKQIRNFFFRMRNRNLHESDRLLQVKGKDLFLCPIYNRRYLISMEIYAGMILFYHILTLLQKTRINNNNSKE